MCVSVYTVLMHICVFMCVPVHEHVCVYMQNLEEDIKWLYSSEIGSVTELITGLVASDPQ